MWRGRWGAGGRRRSRVSSQQAGLGGLPQAHEPVEAAHQHVYLLRARARLGGGLELLANAGHFPAPLLAGFGGDLVQDGDDFVARRLVLGHLPQIIGELLALGTELAEAVHEGRLRTARRVGIAHWELQLYQETGSEERLPGVRGASSFGSPWSDPRSSNGCVRSTGGPTGGPLRSPWRLASGSCCAPTWSRRSASRRRAWRTRCSSATFCSRTRRFMEANSRSRSPGSAPAVSPVTLRRRA